MATSGIQRYRRYETTHITGYDVWVDYVFEWHRLTYDRNKNTSTIGWSLRLECERSKYGTLVDPWTVIVDGKTYTGTSGEDIGGDFTGSVILTTGIEILSHNTEGPRAFAYSFGQKFSAWDGVNGSAVMVSGNDIIDAIPKPATIISGEDFTDYGNPTITYENPGGEAVKSLQACISFDGSTDNVPYREISKTDTTYTFYLTSSERMALRSWLDIGKWARVRFYVKTIFDNGEEFYSYVTNTVTFVDYMPVLTPTVEDINSDTLRLTGNKNTLVRYMSTAYYTINAVARYGATIYSQTVRNGETYSGPEGEIANVYSNTFYFQATDSRGYSSNKAVVFNGLQGRNWIEYVKLTCSFTTAPVTAEGDLVVTTTGKYFEGSFGAAPNKLYLDYIIKASDSDDEPDWTAVENVSPTVNGDSYTCSFTISGLDYNKSYELKLRASDELAAKETDTKVVASANTLFDWGKADFNFNVPVQMNRGFMYPQTLLWQGAAQMDETETIELDHPISEQPTGIILVFSLFRDGAAVDASIHSFFIPRVEIQYLMPEGNHNFLLGINSNFGTIGAKYLTIRNDSISGFEGNTNSGNGASSIYFNNSSFVLRYVIGV